MLYVLTHFLYVICVNPLYVAKSLAKQFQAVWYDHNDDEDKARARMHALIEGTSQGKGYGVRG
jgi:hypothetical protein